MNKFIWFTFFAVMMIGEICFADEITVRSAIDDMQVFCVTAKTDTAKSIKSWGFSAKLRHSAVFTNACVVVSNNWQCAMNDWTFYSTNAVARQFFVNLCGFAGTNTLVGVWNRMLDISEADTNNCPPMTIYRMHDAIASPLEDFVMLHYDNPTISNCLIRSRQLFPIGSDERFYYDEVLSGEQRREWELEQSVRQTR